MQSKEIHTRKKTLTMTLREPKCCMCRSSQTDPLNLGEMKSCKGYHAHYYCLLLSTTIFQHGEDDEGILGFLPSDIKSELMLSKDRMCYYCKKSGASVKCDNVKCRLVFHLPCGIKNNSNHQFHQEYKSHCQTHRPKLRFIKPEETQSCLICLDELDFSMPNVLWAPCCKKKSFFHKACLQQMALSAGYFFKCPICNNTEVFQKTMKNFGVFIPDRDASWELVPNAFEDLLYRHKECNAVVCHSKKGRKHNTTWGPWTIVLCSTCGSQGTHLLCSMIKRNQKWCCNVCNSVSSRSTPKSSQAIPATTVSQCTTISNVISSTNESVNIGASTSRDSQNNSVTACASNPNASKGQGKKRKRSEAFDKKVEDVPNTYNPPNTTIVSPEPAIEIDSDSDVVVIEEDEPAYKCLLAKDGKVLPVRTIVKQENSFLVQGDLNIRENPKSSDGIMNLKISDVRSLNEHVPAPSQTPLEPPPLTPAPNFVVKMNKGSFNDKRGVPSIENRQNNMYVYTPDCDVKNGKNAVNLIDNQGNVFILKEIMGYQITKSENNKVVEDQNNQNAGNLNNAMENEIVVID